MTADIVPVPERGRRYTAARTVRLGDAGIRGKLRLDALARFLQDVATEDANEAGLGGGNWVVRRTVMEVCGLPSLAERIELTTFCGGIGSRWADRRTSVVGGAATIEVSSLWVFLDEATGRPAPLPPAFLDAYGEAAGGRTVSSRLVHPAPPDAATDVTRRPWPLRVSDFDVLGHVNNAVYWAAVEDAVDEPLENGRLELEYRQPIEPGTAVDLMTTADAGGRRLWLVGPAAVHASAWIRWREPPT